MAVRCSMWLQKCFAARKSSFSHVPRSCFCSSSYFVPYPMTAIHLSCRRRFTETKVLNNSKTTDAKFTSEQLLHAKILDESRSNVSEKYDKSSEEEKKKKDDEFRKRAMKYTFLAFGTMFTGMMGLIIYEWGGPQLDAKGNEIEDEFTGMPVVKQYILRTYKEIVNYNKMIRDPSREKLLPEPLKEPYIQPPYTLVLEMTDVLVHPDWTYRTGWRFKKRPGVDYFLQQVGPPLFEVVIYTTEQGFTAYPILDALDPHGNIMYRLFRDATRYVDGHHVKDLSCLNRDLSRVIFIDCDSKSFSLQPENALMLKKWTGDDEDKTLYDLANLLRTIATSEVEDVRSVLGYYSQFDDPIFVFKENQRKLKEEEQKRSLDQQGKSSLVTAFTSGLRGAR